MVVGLFIKYLGTLRQKIEERLTSENIDLRLKIMKIDVIYTKDCLVEMPKRLPDESIGLMACDPQYGWNFMGKDWDRAVPSTNIWRQCFRVLKPGAFAFIMSGPRLDCLIENGIRIREAGFVISFTPIFWCFASGFPKAQNIGKAVDKRLGAKRKVIGQKIRGDVEKAKQSGTTFAVADANKNNKDIFGYGVEDITLPATPQAQALDGSYAGFQPKPAVEVIIVAMKPLSEKTYVDQALKNKKGITWLDDGRVPYKSKEPNLRKNKENWIEKNIKLRDNKLGERSNPNIQGRFPANLLVSDDVLNNGRNFNRGGSISNAGPRKNRVYGEDKNPRGNWQAYGDSGSFSRYFSLDAWFDKKLKELPKGVQKTFPFLIVPKASKAEKNRGCEELYWEKDKSSFGYHQIDRQRWEWLGKEEERIHKETGKRVSLRARGNIHPTVKPSKLGSYLITIGSRKGDVVLDPFGGSGWTAIAAKALGRHYIVFETIKENVEIAKKRLSQIQLELL